MQDPDRGPTNGFAADQHGAVPAEREHPDSENRGLPSEAGFDPTTWVGRQQSRVSDSSLLSERLQVFQKIGKLSLGQLAQARDGVGAVGAGDGKLPLDSMAIM